MKIESNFDLFDRVNELELLILGGQELMQQLIEISGDADEVHHFNVIAAAHHATQEKICAVLEEINQYIRTIAFD